LLERLNTSQREVATAMLSSSRCDSLVIVHGIFRRSSTLSALQHSWCFDYTGPPGTGKTTTIAAAAATWVDHGVPCWVVAQSNVGVKNIAETLVRRGVKFKLLVSKDFIFEW
jgi:signal recognition particle GTPase